MNIVDYYWEQRKSFYDGDMSDGAIQELSEKKYVRAKISGDLLIVSSNWHVDGCVDSGARRLERSPIVGLSADSARRMRGYLRASASEYQTLITLTYPQQAGYDGTRAKRDLSTFFKRVWRNGVKPFRADQEPSIFWFLEFQKRGCVHFHLYTNFFVHKDFVSQAWYEICGTEDERHRRSGTRCESFRHGRSGFCAYAAKYAAKQTQKTPPEGFGWVGRFWGVSGCRTVVEADVIIDSYVIAHVDIQRRLETLQKLIDSLVEEGEVTELEFNKDPKYLQTARVFRLSTKARARLMPSAMMLQLYQALHYDMKEYPKDQSEELTPDWFEVVDA